MNNADFIIPVEIDGTVHQVGTLSAEVTICCYSKFDITGDPKALRIFFFHALTITVVNIKHRRLSLLQFAREAVHTQPDRAVALSVDGSKQQVPISVA